MLFSRSQPFSVDGPTHGDVFPWGDWLLFVLVPWLFVGILVGQAWSVRQSSELRQAYDRLMQESFAIVAQHTPPRFVEACLHGVIQLPALPAVERQQQDGSATLFSGFGHWSHEELVVNPTFQAFATWPPNLAVPDELETQLCTLLGFQFSPSDALHTGGRIRRVSYLGREGWFVWFPTPEKTRRLHLFVLPPAKERLKTLLSLWLGQNAAHSRGQLIDVAQRSWSGTPDIDQGLRRSLFRAPAQQSSSRQQNGNIAFLASINPELMLYLERKIPIRVTADFSWRLLIFWFIGLIPGSLLTRSLERNIRKLPVSPRLVLLLTYLFAFPVAGALVLNAGLSNARQANVLALKQVEARQTLVAFDREFRHEEERVLRTCIDLSRQAGDTRVSPLPQFKTQIQRTISGNMLDRAEFRSGANKLVFKSGRIDNSKGFELFSQMFADYILEEFGVPAQQRRRSSDFMREIFEEPMLGLTEIVRKPGHLQPIVIGNTVWYWFWQLFRGTDSPIALSNLNRARERMVQIYLQRHIIKPRAVRLLAHYRPTGQWFGIPQAPASLRDVADVVHLSGTALPANVVFDRQEFSVIAMRGLRLADTELFAAIPGDVVADTTALLWRDLGTGIVLSLLLAALIFSLLQCDLLNPISNLSRGIQALRRRESNFRIPVLNTDELGRMAQAFNQMLETVGDLATAQAVQEAMAPNLPPLPEHIEIRFSLRHQTELGGDYLELLSFPHNKLVFILGTVPGTGIAAALLVAMVKAAVVTLSATGRSLPEILQRLQRMLREQDEDHEGMPLLAGILDTSTGRLDLLLAGNRMFRCVDADGRSLPRPTKCGEAVGQTQQLDLHQCSYTLQHGSTFFAATDKLSRQSSEWPANPGDTGDTSDIGDIGDIGDLGDLGDIDSGNELTSVQIRLLCTTMPTPAPTDSASDTLADPTQSATQSATQTDASDAGRSP